jgi:hypothetical protein
MALPLQPHLAATTLEALSEKRFGPHGMTRSHYRAESAVGSVRPHRD